MSHTIAPRKLVALLLASLAAAPCFAQRPERSRASGSLRGTVIDANGSPLMGATVLVVGPVLAGSAAAEIERLVTDAQGRFAAERLAPGWYALRVTAPTRLPALRDGVRVEAGATAEEKFVLSGIFDGVQVRKPSSAATRLGDDWKWILRTGTVTRPLLRYEEADAPAPKTVKASLPATQKLVGLLPEASGRQSLDAHPGMGSVLAYLRPLSEDSDVLVTGSMSADGMAASSLATAMRRTVNGDPQEISVAVHQLTLADGVPLPAGDGREGQRNAQAIVTGYSHTRHLFESLTLTAGMELDYLNSAVGVMMAQPRVKLEYRLDPRTSVAVHYGAVSVEGDGSLAGRIGTLSAFPRVTMLEGRERLERLEHAEVRAARDLGNDSRVEFAAFQDQFGNAVVWAFGSPAALTAVSANALLNPAADAATLDAGNFRSSGFRATYSRRFGKNLDTAVVYSLGRALVADGPTIAGSDQTAGFLRPVRSHAVAAKVSGRIPASRTQVTASYQWLESRRVTDVDPYSQGAYQIQPFLDLRVRQPLPQIAFIPAHIEALADFRNLLAQGYVRTNGSADPLLLSPAYRCLRGGFSVQF